MGFRSFTHKIERRKIIKLEDDRKGGKKMEIRFRGDGHYCILCEVEIHFRCVFVLESAWE